VGRLDRAVLASQNLVTIHNYVCSVSHAGGSAHAFKGWENLLPDTIELVIYNPAGRGLRLNDPLHSSWEHLVEEIMEDIVTEISQPFVFFGHSFGSTVAFEIARALRSQNLPLPLGLLVSASPAPHLPLADEKR